MSDFMIIYKSTNPKVCFAAGTMGSNAAKLSIILSTTKLFDLYG